VTISFTQEQAGFTSVIDENIIEVELKESTYNLINRLKKDLVIEGKEETILADTAVKLQSKLHQIYSGTIKFDSGKTMVLDTSKVEAILRRFKDTKIVIFYKFIAELEAIKKTYLNQVTTDLEEFNTTNKTIALQIVSGREGLNLSRAKYIVFLNIDHSAVSYWQARDRLTTIDRKENNIFWVFAKKGIERAIYKAVMNKKSFTTSHFKKYLNE
jgi:DNA-binding transcriptional regulator YiaG